MYILQLAWKKLLSRPGNTIFSVLLFAIGSGIISLIIIAEKNVNQSIERNFQGIDLVVGAKGSPVQLILSSVLHADNPTGNISLAEAEKIARHPLVEMSIPLAMGDSYKGFRIVGAPTDYPALYNAELESGIWYSSIMEVVIGANVAKSTGLGVGDTFYGVHGFQGAGHAHEEHVYTVTGVMKQGAGLPDNLILTPVASVWEVHDGHDHNHAEEDHNTEHSDHNHDHSDAVHHDDHDHQDDHHHHEGAEEIPSEIQAIQQKIDAGSDISLTEMQLYQQYQDGIAGSHDDGREITAMLLQFRNPAGLIQLTRLINESTQMQAASPALEINRLVSLLSSGFDVMWVLAWIIIILSGINIFIHLWNTLRLGMLDIALMRVLGAGRAKVFLMLIFQGAVIAFMGWLVGLVFSRVVWILLPSIYQLTDSGWAILYPREAILLGYALFTGVAASLIPAWNAYKTDVHFTLTRK
jgi:putative ABC transport system permease protein